MITTFRRVSVFLLVALSGCAAFDKGRLDPHLALGVTVSKMDPPAGCEYRGEIKGATPLGDMDDANSDVLRKAVLRGGNWVAVDLVERPVIVGLGTYVVQGRLFACPLRLPPQPMAAAPSPPAAPSPAPAAPPAAATPAPCEPECGAGFTCQLGACIAVPAPQATRPAN